MRIATPLAFPPDLIHPPTVRTVPVPTKTASPLLFWTLHWPGAGLRPKSDRNPLLSLMRTSNESQFEMKSPWLISTQPLPLTLN